MFCLSLTIRLNTLILSNTLCWLYSMHWQAGRIYLRVTGPYEYSVFMKDANECEKNVIVHTRSRIKALIVRS